MKKLLAVVAAAFALVALFATPAFAHASLVSSDPATGADLPAGEPPTAVTLTFTEGVQVADDAIEVLNDTGKAVDDVGDAEHGEASSIVVAELPELDDGTYIVNWHVVSEDGHPINGAFSFNVGEATASGEEVEGLLDTETNRGVGISFAITRALAFGAILVLVGGIVFVRAGWPHAVDVAGTRAMLWVAWLVALVTAPIGIGLQTAYTNRSELSAAWDLDLVRDVLDSDFGRGWLIRIGLLLLAIPFVRRPAAKRAPVVTALALALGVAILASISMAGHARTGRWTTLAFVTDVLHLSGAAVWLGGLAVLVVLLCTKPVPHGSTAAATRFSQFAAPAIAVVVVTGMLQSWRQLDGLGSLLDTTYGRLLLAKIGLVILILAAASASRAIVRGRATEPVPVGVGVGAGPVAGADASVDADANEFNADDARDLRNSVVVEVVIAALVLVVTAALVYTQPALSEAEGESGAGGGATTVPAADFETTLRSEQVDFAVKIAPAIGGLNDVEIVTKTPNGDTFEPIEISATFEEPNLGIQAIDVPLSAEGPGIYRGATQLVAGEWRLEIKALVTEIEQETVTGTIPIR